MNTTVSTPGEAKSYGVRRAGRGDPFGARADAENGESSDDPFG
jgi:hypothetical protein